MVGVVVGHGALSTKKPIPTASVTSTDHTRLAGCLQFAAFMVLLLWVSRARHSTRGEKLRDVLIALTENKIGLLARSSQRLPRRKVVEDSNSCCA